METLLIKPDPASDHAQWVVIDSAGNPHSTVGQGALGQVHDIARQRRIVCMIPAVDIYLGQALLPAQGNRNKYRQAVPFALEDDLVEDLEELHFALGKEQPVEIRTDEENVDVMAAGKQVNIPVAVINKECLRGWLQKLAAAGLQPHVLVSEVLSLPWDSNAWSVLLDERQALVRTQPLQGFACDPENLETLLNSALDASDSAPQQIRIWNHNGVAPSPALKSEVNIEQLTPDQSLLVTLARGYRHDQAINLLQGEFSYKEEYGKLLRPWRMPVILLAALAALLFVSNTIQYFKLSKRSDELRQEMVGVYMELYPDALNVPDPRKQLEDKLNELIGAAGASSHFMELLDQVASELTKLPNVKITTLNFNNESLDMELSLPNLQVLDQLKEQLDKKPDLSTEIQSASAEGEQIKGQLKIGKR
ncbi:MAG TPA: type II secretion system protein GspL [Gammaproteobacteria bacterium]|nr:type II secretion system protein GspL [Gammaproteobacteria bacterium]